MNSDRTYIPGPLPSKMGWHTPDSLRRAMEIHEVGKLIRRREYDKADELAKHYARMRPVVTSGKTYV